MAERFKLVQSGGFESPLDTVKRLEKEAEGHFVVGFTVAITEESTETYILLERGEPAVGERAE